MRIDQLEINNFGKFRDQKFDFSKTSTIFFGENEAGKSTLVAFINQVLFGFAKKNSRNFDNYQFETNPTIYGGSITFSDDQDTWLLERLQAKNSLAGNLRVWYNGEEVDEILFFQRIKNIDLKFFSETFLFDQTTLGQIFGLNQTEIVTQINHLGASNSAELMKLALKLEKSADQIYRPRAQKLILNQNLNEIVQLDDDLIKNSNQAKEYLKLEQEANPLRTKLTELTVQKEELSTTMRNEQQLVDKFGILTEYEQVKGKIREVPFNQDEFKLVNNLDNELKYILAQKENVEESIKLEEQALGSTKLESAKQLATDWVEINHLHQTNSDLTQQVMTEQSSLSQIFIYQPELKKINLLSDGQIEQLRNDFQEVKQQRIVTQQEQAKETQQRNSSKQQTAKLFNNPQIGFGLLMFVIGIVLILNKINILGFGLMIIAVLTFGSGFFIQRKNSKTHKKVEYTQTYSAESKLAELSKQFTQKYQIEVPAELNGLLIQASTTNDKVSHIKLLQGQIITNQKMIDQFLDRLATQIFPAEVNSEDWAGIQAQVRKIYEQTEQVINQRSKLTTDKNLLVSLNDTINKKQSRLQVLLENNQVTTVQEFGKVEEEARKQQEYVAKLASLKSMIGDDFSKLTQATFNISELQQNIVQKKNAQKTLDAKTSELQQKLADYNIQQKMLGNDKVAIRAQTAVSDKQEEIKSQVIEWLSRKMSADWLNSMLNLASQNRFPKMINSSRKYLKILSGSKYDVVEIADKITIKNSKINKKLSVGQLSRGTSEQLYFALKLAFIEQIEDEINLPILIDDAFVNFDDKRLQYMKQLLDELGQKHQIFVFTSRTDMAELFSQSQIINL